MVWELNQLFNCCFPMYLVQHWYWNVRTDYSLWNRAEQVNGAHCEFEGKHCHSSRREKVLWNRGLRGVQTVVLLYDVVLVQKYVYDLLLHHTLTFVRCQKFFCPNGRTQHFISVVYENRCARDFSVKRCIFVQNIAFLFYIPTLVFLCDCFFSISACDFMWFSRFFA